MPFPSDPEKQEIARARMRAASQLRWSRPEERERTRANSLRQFADPEQRQIQSESKLRMYAARPDVKRKIADALQVARARARQLRAQRLEQIRERAQTRGNR